MLDSLAAISKSLIDPILKFYTDNGANAGYFLASGMGLFFIASLGLAVFWHLVTVEFELRRRADFLQKSLKLESLPDVEARTVVAQRWGEICAELGSSKYKPFKHAWGEFRETLIDESASPIRNTERPQSYFMSLRGRTRWLETAANLSVGVGLLLTFIGLVAALSAVKVGAGGDPETVMTGLEGLLSAASAKFVTSVVGVAMSIGYRLADRVLSLRLAASLSRISGSLEKGLLFTSAQQLAAEQVSQLSQQTVALKELATEISVQLGERFAAAVQPVAQSISDLRTSMLQGYEMQAAALRDGAGSAISGSVGAEMNALAAKLATVGESIAQMQTILNKSGADVSDGIDRAGARLETVSSVMEQSFRQLSAQLAGMGSEMAEKSATQIGKVIDRFQQVFASAEATGVRQQAMISDALAQMEAAIVDASERMATGAQDAIVSAVAHANETLRTSTESMALVFENVAQKAQAAVGAFQLIETSIASQSKAFNQASQALHESLTTATSASANLRSASSATEAILKNTSELAVLMKEQSETSKCLAEKLADCAQAVEDAWEQHSDRFSQADEHMAEAIARLNDILREAEDKMIDRVLRVDNHFAKAVGQLGTLVEELANNRQPLHT